MRLKKEVRDQLIEMIRERVYKAVKSYNIDELFNVNLDREIKVTYNPKYNSFYVKFGRLYNIFYGDLARKVSEAMVVKENDIIRSVTPSLGTLIIHIEWSRLLVPKKEIVN
ncbi:hypothetical protein HRbin04_00437 [archaeon HR04]|nr:hypothetical conserved protein [uncultured crenarchaeote]GBC73041.1 hypothetical protein HRbin04_00437 [archaeon HR04]